MYMWASTRNIMALQHFFFYFCFLFTCFFYVLPLLFFLFLVHMCPCLYVLSIFVTFFYFLLVDFVCISFFSLCCAGVWNHFFKYDLAISCVELLTFF